MTRPVLAERSPDLGGLRVLVIGLGKSGLAAARLACNRGARVTVTDSRDEAALGAFVDRARAAGATVVAGGHPPSLLEDADLVIVSPGVPSQVELSQEARRRKLPVWGEIELAARFCRGRVIGITGSNGKSTVTSMIGMILREAGIPGGTGGNLATPLADLLQMDEPGAVHSVELSSFQLETTETLHAEIALLLNLSPDHLDRYAGMEDYARAKARLLELQKPEGCCLLNADDDEIERFRPSVRGKLYLFSTRGQVERGAFLEGGRLILRLEQGDEPLLERAEISLPGEHNVSNALAAALACRLAGCPAEAIRSGLRKFRALPHRLELVRTLNDVGYYNDSKATNPASTARALAAFAPGSVHLILGGRDKGADWSELAPLVKRHARQLLLIGEAAGAIEQALGGTVPVADCGSVEAAVARGHADASHGEVLLLAPACASFDQYANFEARGDDFREAVAALEGQPDA